VIVLNEARRDEIFGTPGFYNTIIAHEIGHLVLHIDSARLHQNVLFRLDSIATNDVEHSIDQWDETNAHRFMAHLLMPAELVVPLARESDLSSWQGLYHLREEFDVTITAMRIRLEKLGFNYVDENGVFHRSRSEALGQKRLI
jgi:Zn-dependent peptidase ImmA (M78 family)